MSCPEILPEYRFTPDPVIHILVMKISDILGQVLPGAVSPDYQGKPSQRFKKEDFARAFLSKEELALLNRFRALKKQVEWVSGRVALKTLVQNVLEPDLDMENLNIGYEEKGAPFITHLPLVPVSLSHSGDFTAVTLSENPGLTLGIDLEKIGPCPDTGFLKTAFTQREIKAMEIRARTVFTHWTLKEAFLKYIKMGFNESLHQVEIINGRVFHRGKTKDVRTWSRVIEKEYVLSLVWK
ncbi:4'-phosphopantetheinyl transferase family protein [Desulfospira joergensenii]|uniref:4'-phosphopantetheinyl transferase family protein n=1 Tax=Desulfospira joergensenii TaxID=53329 RepID=UPI0009FE7B45|nr:4'-phosphopantetheinyl transferase superfamily protein [Desulfospira joergensenii]